MEASEKNITHEREHAARYPQRPTPTLSSSLLAPAPPSLPGFPQQPTPLVSRDGSQPGRAPDWPDFRAPRDWPGAAGPRLPPPPRRGPREGGESRDFREPVRKDINKTNRSGMETGRAAGPNA